MRIFWGLGAIVSLAQFVYPVEIVTQLRLDRKIDLTQALSKSVPYPAYIGAAAVASGKIYLLVNPSVFAPRRQAIVTVDMNGTVLKMTPLEVDVEPRWLQLDNATPYVWKRARAAGPGLKPQTPETLYRIDSNSAMSPVARFEHRLIFPAKLGDSFWGITPTGCMKNGAAAEVSVCSLITVDPNDKALMFKPLSLTELISIEQGTPAVITLAPESGRLTSRRIVSPEIAYALTSQRANPHNAVILNDFAVMSSEYVVAIVMRQPASKGAAILKIDRKGDVAGSFRCPLARKKEFATNGNEEGFMFPGLVGYSDGAVFVIDRQGMVVMCKLPDV